MRNRPQRQVIENKNLNNFSPSNRQINLNRRRDSRIAQKWLRIFTSTFGSYLFNDARPTLNTGIAPSADTIGLAA
jgi:hypothetical protein